MTGASIGVEEFPSIARALDHGHDIDARLHDLGIEQTGCSDTVRGVAAAGVALANCAVGRALPGQTTLIADLAVWPAFTGAIADYVVALVALAACVDQSARDRDAATLRSEIDELRRELQQLERRLADAT